jgi:hypothetical protein
MNIESGRNQETMVLKKEVSKEAQEEVEGNLENQIKEVKEAPQRVS